MSATLIWFNSGLGVKTGTAIGDLFADLVTLIQATDNGADFTWEYAGSNTGSTPYWIVIKPKGGGAGRILIVSWSSAPAGNNAAILEGNPVANQLFFAYFPAGNTDSASNLTASSGTIMGDDTGCTKVAACSTVANLYTTLVQAFYFDSAEGCFLGFQNPANATIYAAGAGNLVVDAADTAYACAIGYASQTLANFTMPWTATPAVLAGVNTACIRTNYGSSNRVYFHAYSPPSWAGAVVSSTDILSDSGANKRYFAPVHLLQQTVKGEGPLLKLRQIALGSASTAAFEAHQTTGPVVKARHFCAGTTGGTLNPWFVNFKL